MVPSVLAQFCPDPGFSIVYFSPLGPPKPAPEPSCLSRVSLCLSRVSLCLSRVSLCVGFAKASRRRCESPVRALCTETKKKKKKKKKEKEKKKKKKKREKKHKKKKEKNKKKKEN